MKLSWTFLGNIVIVHYFLATSTRSDAFNNDTDHMALLEFKTRITADPFGVLSSWNASTHFCNWHGVSCGRRHSQRVTVLDLSHSKLAGSISPHIGNLTFLKQVYLRNNTFTGQIPPEIGNLRRLQQLLLHSNSLQGTIPANVSSCTQLIQFSAARNKLVGEVPVELGSLSKLKGLFLSSNRLTGHIPSSFGNLTYLEELSMPKNNLFGTVPDGLGQLRNIKSLSFGENMLMGRVPPSIFNLSSMTQLDLGFNQIHGTLPSNLGTTLPNLQYFSIVNNQFTGSIPTSVSNASNLAVFQLNENNFHGKVPCLEKLHMLRVLTLSSNSFGGVEDDLIFLCSLTNATTLLHLYLNDNNFGGTLPECITNLSTSLGALMLDNNKISGNIPTGIGNLVNLERLHMWNNQLSGHLPPELGNLQKMLDMVLGSNKLSGTIPSTLGNLKLLLKLYLYSNNIQGSIPSNLSQCQNLVALGLFDNNLSGNIPPSVIGIKSLSIRLSLIGNQLTGPIPMEVANLNNLGILDVSDNLLSGEIPHALGSCIKLETLKLGGNLFQGDIPSSLSSLRGIQELNFSHNNLSGGIPKFLESLGSLQSLDLSYNNFQGMVPKEGAFKNASATHVKGNKELCGGVPELQLPKCKPEASKKKSLTLVLIKVIAPISVFLVLCFALSYLYRKRRRAQASSKVLSLNVSFKPLLKAVSYKALLKATDGFSEANMIGMGSFGSVYKGVLDHGQMIVAVKVFNLLRPGGSKSFMAECEALKNVRHRNLVRVLTSCSGVDYDGNDFKALVYEFMVNGSLEDWLHPHPSNTKKLNLVQRLNIMIDVATAIDYLHHRHHQSPIVHCDLKPSNILLDSKMMARVGDFGLSRFLQDVTDKETSSIAIRGSIGYTAPEYGMGSKLSTEGDVYSFGILMLEVLSGKRPTAEIFQGDMNLRNFVSKALPERAIEILDHMLLQEVTREAIVLNSMVSIYGVGLACSADSPSERLSSEEVVTQLSAIRRELVAQS